MRVLFFTDGPESPGSRFRCLQFFPHLEARGIRCEAKFAYDHHYNDVFARPWAPAYKLWGRLKRVAHLLATKQADLLFLHKTALAVTGMPEWLRSLGKTPIIFDFDDAIYLGPGGLEDKSRRRAFERVVSVADHLIAGNAHLGHVAGRSAITTVIPSVVDTDTYRPPPPRSDREDLVVGWIGTASNFPSLRLAVPSIVEALKQHPRARLRIVSNGELPEYIGHPQVEQWRWNAAGELRAIQSFDIGLMPLDDSELTRGKCSFKMIQYMAVGVPVLSSAIGANIDVFEGSSAGALVTRGEDWGRHLSNLIAQRARFPEMGKAGRAHAVSRYSIHAVIERYVEVFERTATKGAQAPFLSPSP